jgi:RimJ/RimL family protein N-acetyltransferase|tara:strand:- start:203 stop:856 length:654 start_codon:yes stop_codon:yes gene_type:complete
MTFFHDKIKQIKDDNSTSILEFKFLQKTVSLKVVDDSDETINLLTKWRKENWDGFDSKFEITFRKTKQWVLNQILKNPNRILFLIIFDGKKIGQYGINGYDEKNDSIGLGDLIKGEHNIAPGIMKIVEKEFLKWIFQSLKISSIKGKVFSDNFRTLNLHNETGWTMVDSIPIKRIYTEDGWKWEEMKLQSEEEYGERYFNIIEITKEKLMEKIENKI